MVPDSFISVSPFFVAVGSGGHKTVDGGNEQAVEDEDAQKVDEAMLEIFGAAFVPSGLLDNGYLVVIAGVLYGVELIPVAVRGLFYQNHGADKVPESTAHPAVWEKAQAEVQGDNEDEECHGDLLAGIIGENPVEEQQGIF